jgi:hypothetical protein
MIKYITISNPNQFSFGIPFSNKAIIFYRLIIGLLLVVINQFTLNSLCSKKVEISDNPLVVGERIRKTNGLVVKWLSWVLAGSGVTAWFRFSSKLNISMKELLLYAGRCILSMKFKKVFVSGLLAAIGEICIQTLKIAYELIALCFNNLF